MTRPITLVIKGNRVNALAAADKRYINITILHELFSSTTATTNHSNLEDIIKWYCEDGTSQAPYPPGSLLLFTVGRHTL
jgi:hypothetical protein